MGARDSIPKLRLATLATLILLGALGAAPSDPVDPPPPQSLPSTGICYLDNIFYGAVPPGGENERVLVFVHGLSGLAQDWWLGNSTTGPNDMYLQAYSAGYRTAFVNLNVSPATPADCVVQRRPAYSALSNGFVLRQQLDAITQYYGASQVDIVAHSKGGIDAQAAIVWWDAWPRVHNVFTLGTPHQGSLLADLLWSPEGYWVGLWLGQRDDATYSIRTGAMQLFRSAIDPSRVDDGIRYYTGVGNFWQTPDSIYLVTGEWLQNHYAGGQNDGLVDLPHTYLPGATSLFLQPWNHSEVYLGQNAFPYIHQILLGDRPDDFKVYLPLIYGGTPSAASATTLDANRRLEPPDAVGWPNRVSATRPAVERPESNFILRGGRLDEAITELVPIEPQARAANFTLLTTEPQVTAILLGPDGLKRPLLAVANDDRGILGAAYAFSRGISQPSPGQWMIQLNGPPGTGYLLILTLDSPLRVSLNGLPNQPISPGAQVRLSAHSQATMTLTEVNQIRLRLSRSVSGPDRHEVNESAIGAGAVLRYDFLTEGLYGISVTVSGHTSEGLPFERTFVHSLAVIPSGKLADTPTVLDWLSGK